MVINRTNHTKFLGVTVDQHLTFESHVRYIKGKYRAGLAFCIRQKDCYRHHQCWLYTIHLCSPIITVWGNTYSTVLDPLIKCQKRAVRIVHGAGKYDHTYPIFQSLQILNLRKLHIYSVQIFLYKYRQQKLPGVFCNFFTVASTIHEHQTRQNNHCRAPLVFTLMVILLLDGCHWTLRWKSALV